QNQGGLEVFGTALSDSINISHLSQPEKDQLEQNIRRAVNAIKEFAAALKKIDADKNYVFRSFRIGKKLFDQKFKYDIATDLTPEQIYRKAMQIKTIIIRKCMLLPIVCGRNTMELRLNRRIVYNWYNWYWI